MDEDEYKHGKLAHSVKVPRLYKSAAKALSLVEDEGQGVKTAVHSIKHPNIKAVTALVSESLRFSQEIADLIEKTNILEKEPALAKQIYLLKILMTELLWGKKLLQGESKPILTVNKYSKKFQKALAEQKPEDFADVSNGSSRNVKELLAQKPRYVRVNLCVTTVNDTISYFKEEGWIWKENNSPNIFDELGEEEFTQDVLIPEILIFPPKTYLGNHQLYHEGWIVLQDKASCLPALALNPYSGKRIIDSCAAPGMKTSHLAALIKNEGEIIAIEKDRNRCETLHSMIESLGVKCATVLNNDFTNITPEEYADTEYILVDPSCSGSGMISRIDGKKGSDEELKERLMKLAHYQMKLLTHAMTFPNVKRIVYSTCSLHSEENEDVVDYALKHYGGVFRLKYALPEWTHRLVNARYSWAEKCVKADFETDRTDGFFVALFQRIKLKKKKTKDKKEGQNSEERVRKRKRKADTKSQE